MFSIDRRVVHESDGPLKRRFDGLTARRTGAASESGRDEEERD